MVLLQDQFDAYRTTYYPICIKGLSDVCFGSIQYWSNMLKKQLKLVKNVNSANSANSHL